MTNKHLKRNDGFTIIEVLIVLAIAGLIMLIVFLAVPALQRNARNTSRKSDASSLGSAFAEYVNNNDGQIPAGDFQHRDISWSIGADDFGGELLPACRPPLGERHFDFISSFHDVIGGQDVAIGRNDNTGTEAL